MVQVAGWLAGRSKQGNVKEGRKAWLSVAGCCDPVLRARGLGLGEALDRRRT